MVQFCTSVSGSVRRTCGVNRLRSIFKCAPRPQKDHLSGTAFDGMQSPINLRGWRVERTGPYAHSFRLLTTDRNLCYIREVDMSWQISLRVSRFLIDNFQNM